MNIIKDAFKDISRLILPEKTGKVYGSQNIQTMNSMQIGQGSNVMRADQSGLWLGDKQFDNAPFSVDMNGQMRAKEAVFEDEDGTTIVDSQGLVSTNTFRRNQAGNIDLTSESLNSTTVTDVPDMEIASFTLKRTTMCIINLTALLRFEDGVGDGSGEGVRMWIYIGGEVNDIQEPRISLFGSNHVGNGFITLSTQNFRTLPVSGDPVEYTIKAKWQTTSNATGYVNNRIINYMLFGN